MIHLPVEPGDHDCTWLIDGMKLAGVVSLHADASPVGRVYDAPESWEPRTDEAGAVTSHQLVPKSKPYEAITGTLRDGRDFILLDARMNKFLGPAFVRGRTAVCGFNLGHADLMFDSIVFQVGGLTELSGVQPIKKTSFPNRLDQPGAEFRAEWNPQSTQKWQRGQDSIYFRYESTLTVFDPYQFSIETSPMIEVSGPRRRPEEWLQDYVFPLRDLTSIASTNAQPICCVVLGRNDEIGGVTRSIQAQLFAADVTQSPYLAVQSDKDSDPLLRLGSDRPDLPTLMDNWKQLGQDCPTFVELYSTAIRDQLPIRSSFLTLVPALESLHGTTYGTGPVPLEQHKERRRGILERLKSSTLDEGDRKWIKRWLNGRGDYPLHERLEKLANDLPPELRDLIRKAVEPIPTDMHQLMPEGNNVWEVMGRARNDVAHGGEPHTDQDLVPFLRLARTIATGHILVRLGVPVTELASAIDQKEWRVC